MFKSFFGKILLVVLPFICVMMVLADISIKKGQIIPPHLAFIQQLENHDLIYRPAWTRTDEFYYKFTAVNYIQPDVMIIGSSRIQAWRMDYMFRDTGIGYNASVSAAEPIEMAWFIEGLEQRGNLPKIIIISLDHQFFNADSEFIRRNRVETVVPPLTYSFDYVVNRFRVVVRDNSYITNPRGIFIFYQNYRPTNNVGTVAQDTGRGYRYDGSYTFPNVFELSSQLIERHQESFNNGESIFERGDTVDEEAVNAIHTILGIASRNDVIVVGVILPYNSVNYRETIESGHFTFIPQVLSRLDTLFSQYGMPLLDFTNPESVGGSDAEMYDYWHAGEVLSLRAYRQTLIELPEIFSPYSDIEAIEMTLDNNHNRFSLP